MKFSRINSGVVFTVRLRSIRTVFVSTSVCPSVRLYVKRVHCDKTKAPSEKSSIMTNRKSPTSFPMNLRRTSYVAPSPQTGPEKRFFSIFRIKNGLYSKKVCYKVSLCENFQRQSCKAFTAYLAVHIWLVGDVPFYLKYWAKVTHPLHKLQLPIDIRPWRLYCDKTR